MSTETGRLKLLLSYDIDEEIMEAYYRFLMQRFVPLLDKNGIKLIEAWHTTYGSGPMRLLTFTSDMAETMTEFIASDTWDELQEELSGYITDFTFKLAPDRSRFQF